ncbi:MAG: TlpA family protein disulfide reductase [Candidatus Delongbacteria bacterium]|nr:TlpA family protein disulfide reductase [Candidatus Delongbacteria bacterium]
MKRVHGIWLLALVFLLAACEIEENRDYGVLLLQVSDAEFPLTPLTLEITVNDSPPFQRSVNAETPQVQLTGLSLDRSNQILLSSSLHEPHTLSLQFPAGVTQLSENVALDRVQNADYYSTTIRTFTHAGVELNGLPLSVEGAVLPFTTPTSIELPPDTPVLISVSNGSCNRGEAVIQLDSDQAGRVDTLWVDDQDLQIVPGTTDVQVMLDGVPVVLINDQLRNPTPGSWLSAYLPGHAYQAGVSRTLSGMCDAPAEFDWTPVSEGYQLNQLFPEFTLPRSTDGSDFRLSAYRGRVVLVNFWFINCVPCQAELPLLQDVLSEHFDEGFRILSLDPIEPLATQSGWVTDNPQYTIDFLADLQAPYLAAAAGVQVFPKNFLLDRRGVIRMVVGQVEEETFTSLVQQLLAE